MSLFDTATATDAGIDISVDSIFEGLETVFGFCRTIIDSEIDLNALFTIGSREEIGRAKMADPEGYGEVYDAIEKKMLDEIEAIAAGGDV